MVLIQNQTEYLKPDVAVKSSKLDWKTGFASVVVAASVSIGNVSTPPLATTLMRQSVDNARTTEGFWVIHKKEQLSQALFEDLAQTNPRRLLEIVKNGNLEPSLLTFAAESLGSIESQEMIYEVVDILLSLSHYTSSLVREGAVYGLANFLNHSSVLNRLNEMVVLDTSVGVRSAVRDVI
jgi:hypothetical protein